MNPPKRVAIIDTSGILIIKCLFNQAAIFIIAKSLIKAKIIPGIHDLIARRLLNQAVIFIIAKSPIRAKKIDTTKKINITEGVDNTRRIDIIRGIDTSSTIITRSSRVAK